MWKFLFGIDSLQKIEVTLHFYNHNKPGDKKQSKILVQGSTQSLLCEYVLEELPKIYEKVCSKTASLPSPIKNSKRKRIITPIKRRNIRYKPTSKIVDEKCISCDFTSVSKTKMIKHMKSTHTESQMKPPSKLMAEDMSICEINENEDENLVENVNTGNGDSSPSNKPLAKCDVCTFVSRSEEIIKEHKNKKHTNENAEQKTIEVSVYFHSCISCDFKSNDYNSYKEHIDNSHKDTLQKVQSVMEKKTEEVEMKQTSQWNDGKCSKCMKIVRTEIGRERHMQLYCDTCSLCFPERISFDNHMGVQHSKSIKEEPSKSRLELELHVESEHDGQILTHKYQCTKCELMFQDEDDLKKHMEMHGQNELQENRTVCDQCGYSCENDADFLKHLQMEHDNAEVIKCRHCDYKAISKDNMYDHIEHDHIEYAMLASLTAGQSNMDAKFGNFENELTKILNKLIDSQNKIIEGQSIIKQDQNIIKQELFILRQGKCDNTEKIKKMEESFSTISKSMENVGKLSEKNKPNSNSSKFLQES